MNKVQIEGPIQRPPKSRIDGGDRDYANFTIAVSTGRGEQRAFIDVVCFGALASEVAHLNPGTIVTVEGRIVPDNYEDKDGRKVYRLKVSADKITTKEGAQTNKPEEWPGQKLGYLKPDVEPF